MLRAAICEGRASITSDTLYKKMTETVCNVEASKTQMERKLITADASPGAPKCPDMVMFPWTACVHWLSKSEDNPLRQVPNICISK